MEWLREIDITPDMLDEDYRLIADLIGQDNLFRLLEMFDKSSVYFSKERLDKPRRSYILKNTSKGVKELSRILGVSERYIYKVIQKKNFIPDNQIKMEL